MRDARPFVILTENGRQEGYKTMNTFAARHVGSDSPLFLAGRIAPPGLYRLVGSQRQVRLECDDVLPATCDGQVGVYERQEPTWAESGHENSDCI